MKGAHAHVKMRQMVFFEAKVLTFFKKYETIEKLLINQLFLTF